MLSTEKPPPDPCENTTLKSSGGSSSISSCSRSRIVSDEKGSDDNNQVDLLELGLDDNNPLHRFSIRDYVFSTRGKDIKTNWPFSPKNLQLCLEHGVKDVLPPFQSLDSVRNPSIVKCDVENISNDAQDINNDSDVKLPESQIVSCDIGQKFGENINSCGSEEDKELPSTTTSQSCSDRNSLLPTKNTYLEADDKPEFAVPASNMVESNIRNPVKKGRLIVKLSGITLPKSNEVLALNTSAVSETMASKVCPVCKTFSSSSNTTLNAHIDQCLSGEPQNKWTENSKVMKHRIKPRKTRLMVDIYATALSCTLEDLDRRNGTNWASNLSVPAQDLDKTAEEKNARRTSVNIEDNSKEGAVYIDSSGTKLRILSKFGDPPSNSNAKDDCGARKLVKKDKGSNSLSSKKKYNFQKHKLQKSSLGERSSRRLDNCQQVRDDHQRELPPEEGYKKEDQRQPLGTAYQMKSDDLGMIKKWVGSKRTGLKKKMNLEHENHHMDKSKKNSTVRSSLSSVGDVPQKRTSDSSSPILFDESPLLDKRKENFSWDTDDENEEQPCLRKRAESSLESEDYHGFGNRVVFSNFNVKQLRKDGSSKKKADVSFIRSQLSSGGKELTSSKKASFNHGRLSGGKKISSLRNASLESKKLQERKRLEFKKPRFHYTSGSDEEEFVPHFANYRKCNPVETPGQSSARMEKGSGESAICRDRVLEIRKKRSRCTNLREEGQMVPESSDTSESDSDGVGKNFDSAVDGMKEVETQDEFVCEPISSIAGREAFMTFSKSLGSEFSGPSDDACVSHQYAKVYEEHHPVGLGLGGEEELYCPDTVGKDLVPPTTTVAEMDSDEGRGNYFVDVDPIPIPGPPGSFLPSPGRMGSEELLGNSSLTTCRIQSSEDEHELVNIDSSESPISTMSMVSQSVAARPGSVSFAYLSMPLHGVHHDTQCDITEDRINPLEISKSFGQTAHAEGKLNLDESMLPEMSALRFKNSQPCCCSMKEAALRSGSLNYQESQLLSRRTTTSVPLPALEKQMGGSHKNEFYPFNLRSAQLEEQTSEPEQYLGNSQMRYSPGLVSHRSGAKFPSCGGFEPPSPSTSNSVFRLMGKNLMVMNKDESLSPQTRPTQSSMMSDRSSSLSSVDNGVCSDNVQNQLHSFHHSSTQTSTMFANTQNNMPLQHFDLRPSYGFKVPANSRTPQFSAHPLTTVLSSNCFGERFPSSLESREYAGGCNSTPNRSYIRSDVEKVRTPVPQVKPANFPGSQQKEIIIIDDSPEGEAAHGGVNMECGGSFVGGISASMAEGYGSRNANSFYGFQTRGYPLGTGSRPFQNANIQGPHSRVMNANIVKWDCTPEDSSGRHPSSLASSLPSTGQQRSSMYFSPGFS